MDTVDGDNDIVKKYKEQSDFRRKWIDLREYVFSEAMKKINNE